ncbi:MAG: transketolase family protein [Planctomycetales bacterium]
MRNAFAAEVTEMALADPRVVMLSGDIGNRLFDKFRDKCPDRFYNCGVAEANMMTVAAGMALSGLRPIVYTITPFVTTRCLEQIRVDVCYHEAPVMIVGVGGGLSYASLGPTHHSCEDIALLRALPNMAVVCPADAVEVRLAMRSALKRPTGCYIRLGKKGEEVIHQTPPESFEIGKAITIRDGRDVCLLSTGNMLPETLHVAAQLAQEGISARVASFHTVKPLDEAYLQDAFRRYAIVCTIEEHSRLGGFGSAVAEWLSDQPRQHASLCRFGTPDAFLHESGEQEHARERTGISADQIAEQIHQRFYGRIRLSA